MNASFHSDHSGALRSRQWLPRLPLTVVGMEQSSCFPSQEIPAHGCLHGSLDRSLPCTEICPHNERMCHKKTTKHHTFMSAQPECPQHNIKDEKISTSNAAESRHDVHHEPPRAENCPQHEEGITARVTTRGLGSSSPGR